jgi:ABC-type multidrug transport system ATPase subunit
MSTPLISFRGAGKRLAGRTILQNLDLAIHQGEALVVIGENGVGKSTLLKMIGGLSTLSEGKREVHRRDPEPKIGYVPDRFPKVRFTGYEYLCFMGLIRGIPKDALERRIEELLRIFKLDREASRRPIRQYSKGMIQKINLMQSIIEPPDILLLDEPLSGLDLQTQEELSRI